MELCKVWYIMKNPLHNIKHLTCKVNTHARRSVAEELADGHTVVTAVTAELLFRGEGLGSISLCIDHCLALLTVYSV